jgi:hypothetical protein
MYRRFEIQMFWRQSLSSLDYLHLGRLFRSACWLQQQQKSPCNSKGESMAEPPAKFL